MPDGPPCEHGLATLTPRCGVCLRYVYHPAKRRAWGGPADFTPPPGWPAEAPADMDPPAPLVRVAVAAAEAAPPPGFGSAMKELLAEFGVVADGCGCDGKAREWDRAGLEWVRANRAEVVAWLRAQRAKGGWMLVARAGAKAMLAGYLSLSLAADPCGWLYDEALRRAEQLQGATP